MVVKELLIKWGFEVDDKALTNLDSGINNVKQSVFAFTAAIGAAAAGVGYLLKEAGEIEQVEIAFETMTGSGEKAKKLMEDITNFAASTPFELKGLIENSKGLLAFGVESDQIVDKMRALGNISAGVGKDKLPTLVRAFGKIRVKGKASMEELNMMLEAGVPILDELAKNFGVNTKEIFNMVSTGKVGFEDVDKALNTMSSGSGKFSGLMEKQSKSFLGIVSNIKDLFDQLVISIGQELLPAAKEIGKEIINLFQANRKLIQQKAARFFKTLFNFVIKSIKAIKDLSKSINAILTPFGGLEEVLYGVMKALVLFMGLKGLLGFGQIAMGATQGIFTILKALKTLRVGMLLTQASAIALPLLIGAAIVALGLIIEDLITYFRGGESVFGGFIEMFKTKFPEAFEIIKNVITAMVSVITLPFKNIYSLIQGIINLVTGDFVGAFNSAKKIISNFMDVGSKIKGAFSSIFGGSGASDITNSANIVNSASPTTSPATSGPMSSNKSVNVNAPINVSVPEGTPPEMVGQKVQEGINQSLSDMLKNASRLNEPLVEF